MSDDKERPVYRSAVFVVVQDADGEYLLQQRSGTGFLDGYYDVSGSGHLEYDESLEACGARELREETGLIVKESDLELVSIFQSNFEKGIHYLNYIYLVRNFTGKLVNGEPTKIDELAWYKPEDFPDRLTIGLRVFLESMENGRVVNYNIDSSMYGKLMGENFE